MEDLCGGLLNLHNGSELPLNYLEAMALCAAPVKVFAFDRSVLRHPEISAHFSQWSHMEDSFFHPNPFFQPQ